jgi:hypothetical protein
MAVAVGLRSVIYPGGITRTIGRRAATSAHEPGRMPFPAGCVTITINAVGILQFINA